MKIVYLLTLIICFNAKAQLRVNPLFSNNAIIQKGQTIKIWGKDTPGNKVYCSIAGKSKSSYVSIDSLWFVELENDLMFNQNYTLEVSSESGGVTFTELVLGDVWLASGQSNMVRTIENTIDSTGNIEYLDTLLNDQYENLRLFKIHPRLSNKEERLVADPIYLKQMWVKMNSLNNIIKQSAVAYYTGRRIHRELNYPIGIIVAAKGNTKIEQWSPNEAEESSINNIIPNTTYFNGTISPLIPSSISGIIFYQGESNNSDTDFYAEKTTACFNSWQNRWSLDFPVFTTLLAGFKNDNFKYLRSEQLLADQKNDFIYLASAFDLGEINEIHPNKKKDLGERLASLVLAEFYTNPNHSISYPMISGYFLRNDSLLITIKNSVSLKVQNEPIIDGLFNTFNESDMEIENEATFLSDSVIYLDSHEIIPSYFEYNHKGYSDDHIFLDGLPMHPYSSKFDNEFQYNYKYNPTQYVIDDSIICSTSSAKIVPFLSIDTLINSSIKVTHVNSNVLTSSQSFSICYGDSAVIGDSTFFEQGDFQVLLENSYGCDSLVLVSIDVLPSDTTIFSQSICYGDSAVISDSTFFEQGDFQVLLENSYGCDSLVLVSIDVLPSDTTIFSQSICYGDSAVISDSTFFEQGDFQVLLENSYGCDSLVLVSIDVLPSDTTIFSQSICYGDSAVIGDSTFFEQGDFQVLLENSYGCDSLVLVSIDVLPSDTTIFSQSICYGDSAVIGDSTFFEQGDFQVLLENSYGCDSLVLVSIDVLPSNNCILNINKEEIDFLIYPNPTEGVLHFSETVKQVTIYSLNGIILMEQYNVKSVDAKILKEKILIIKIILLSDKTIQKRIYLNNAGNN